MNSQNSGYTVPDKSILTGTLAKKIQIIGRVELELGEIGACLGLGLLLIAIFFVTSFMGWDGIAIVIRLGMVTALGAAGKMAVFDRPGGMKYADWLMLWYRYRRRKREGKLDYIPEMRRRAHLVGTRYRQMIASPATEADIEPNAQTNVTATSQPAPNTQG